MLAAADTPVGYIWEPFNPRHRPGTFPIRFPHYFHYLCAENGAACAGPIADMLAFRYRPGAELASLRSARDAGRMGRDWWRFARSRRRGATPLVKDPIALLSPRNGWPATFDMRVLVMIRHPAAFAASIRRRGWRHRFADFLEQPLLMRDLLDPYEDEIVAASERPPAILDEAILLWNILYGTVAGLQERHPEWAFARHEDVAREPVARFRDLYAQLGLGWSDAVEQLVLTHPPRRTRPRPSGRRDPAQQRRAGRGRGGRSSPPRKSRGSARHGAGGAALLRRRRLVAAARRLSQPQLPADRDGGHGASRPAVLAAQPCERRHEHAPQGVGAGVQLERATIAPCRRTGSGSVAPRTIRSTRADRRKSGSTGIRGIIAPGRGPHHPRCGPSAPPESGNSAPWRLGIRTIRPCPPGSRSSATETPST